MSKIGLIPLIFSLFGTVLTGAGCKPVLLDPNKLNLRIGDFTYTPDPAVLTLGQTLITPITPALTLESGMVWSVQSPGLPAGLTIDATTGVISGTPAAITATETYFINVDWNGIRKVGLVVITVNDVAPSMLVYPTSPQILTRTQTATPNVPSYAGGTVVLFSISPALPSGLTINSTTGTISGTPTAISPSTVYTVTAANSGGSTTTTVSITVNDLSPAFTYTTPVVYTIGTAITTNAPVNTGGAVITYGVSPSLPAGLALNTSTGVISGTPTTITPTAIYTVTGTNSGGSGTFAISITVNDVLGSFYYPINPGIYTLGSTITNNVPINTGGAIISYAISAPLPTGLNFDTTTGVISGNPSVLSAATSYTVTATNSGGTVTTSVTIQVNDTVPAFTYVTNPLVLTKDTAMTADNVNSTGGTILSFSVSPTLPAGLALNTSTGQISGTPTAIAATSTYSVTATNSGGTTTVNIPITVNDVPPAFSYVSATLVLTNGTTMTADNVNSTGGTILGFSVSPALPGGLTLNASTGVISGTPGVVSATAIYTVTGTNSGGTNTANVSITVNDVPPSALTYSNPTISYIRNVLITNNTPTSSGGPVITYAISPALPAGLSMNTSTGVISGTPTVLAATATYTVTATNSGGSTTGTVDIAVIDSPPVSLSYTSPVVYNQNTPITNNTPTYVGGVGVTYGVSPALPAGLALNTSTGVISGTPTVLAALATYTVTVSNTGGSTTASISITVVEEGPTNLNYSQPVGTYSINVAIINNIPSSSGGTIATYSVSPALPAGLALNTSTGVISGTPTALTSASSYTVTGSNTGGSTTKVLSIEVTSLAPQVSSIFPSGGSTLGGTPITITGNYFYTGATIQIGGVTCAAPNVVSGTQITCTSGARTKGLTSIVVTNTDSQSGTLANRYLYSEKVWLGGAAQSANAWYSSGVPATGSGDGMLASTLSNYPGSDGFIYVVDVSGHRIAKFNALTGEFIGWIGRINITPTGGAAGCATALSGDATPGWCIGGTSQLGAGDGMFNNPNDVFVDTNGFLYVADVNNHRVQKFNAVTGAFIGWIGNILTTGGTCTAGVGLATGGFCSGGMSQIGTGDGMFAAPRSLRVDPNSNILYVVERDGNRVQKFNAGTGAALGWIGNVKTAPTSCTGGTATLGVFSPGWCTGGTSETAAITLGDGSFISPRGIAVDGSSTWLYVMETNAARVGRYNVTTGAFGGWTGRILTTGGTCTAGVGLATGGWCTGGTSQTGTGDGMIASASRGVWIDSTSDTLYIGDYVNARIQRFDATTGTSTGWIGFVGTTPTGGDAGCTSASVGTMTPGWCTGGTAVAGSGIGQIGGAAVVTMDPSRVYLYLSDDTNARINRYYASSGLPVGSLGAVKNVSPTWIANGVPIAGAGDGVLNTTFASVSDGTYLYFSDTNNHRIVKVNQSTGLPVGWIGRVNVQPTGGAGGCTGAAAGTFTPGWCTGGTSQAGAGAGMLNTPLGIAIYYNGSNYVLYVVDSVNNRIMQYNANTGAFIGWIGRVLTAGVACTGGTPVVGSFSPGWCTDGTAQTGTTATTNTDGRMITPRGIAIDPTNTYLYVTDSVNGRVYRFNRAAGTLSGWMGLITANGGACTAGANNFTGGFCTGGTSKIGTTTGDGGMITPYSITVDSSGNILVADSGAHRINWYNASGVFQGWMGRTLTTGGTCLTGAGLATNGFCTGGTSQTGTGDGMFNSPRGVAFNPTGSEIYVADSANHRIQKFQFGPGVYGTYVGWQGAIATSPTGGEAGCGGAVVGGATPGWCIGGTSAASNGNGMLNTPTGLWINSTYIYINDTNNHRIIRFDR